MSGVKLTYFDMSGLGEAVRLMLSAAKIKFEDKRINKGQWAELKPKIKWPFLPMLEMNGKVYFQSLAICRYIAKTYGLVGSNSEEAFECDITVDHLNDMLSKAWPPYYVPDSPDRAANIKKVEEEDIAMFLSKIQEQLIENQSGFLVGDQLTWADIIFLAFCGFISGLMGHNILEQFPQLKEHEDKLKALPALKDWIEARPEDPEDYRVFYF